MDRIRQVRMAALAALLAAGPAAGQQTREPDPATALAAAPGVPGRVVPRVRSAADSSEHYALYLPSGYSEDRTWPLLILMDPRGRALVPMERFRAAAEEHGYILVSSYGTASDGPLEPNETAFDAMLRDAQRFWAVDMSRLYLSGFSGTSRIAWLFAYALRGHVAGIIGFGAGLPDGTEAAQYATREGEAPFSFYGGSGHLDFNYEELRELEPALAEAGVSHRIVFWDGPHSWAPAPVAAAGIEWMQIEAMRTGLLEPDREWLTRAYVRQVREAGVLESRGRLVDAVRAFRAMQRSFEGLLETHALDLRIQEIANSPAARDEAERSDRLGMEQRVHETRLGQLIAAMRDAPEPMAVDEAAERLRLEELHEQAASDDPLSADAARRVLAIFYAQLSFYQPRLWLDDGQPDHAIAALDLADRVGSFVPVRTCYFRALAHAQAKRLEAAVEQAACVLEGSPQQFRALAAEPAMAPVVATDGFRALSNGQGAEDSASAVTH